MKQLFGMPRVLYVVGTVLALLGLFTPLNTVLFLGFAAVFFIVGYQMSKTIGKEDIKSQVQEEETQAPTEAPQPTNDYNPGINGDYDQDGYWHYYAQGVNGDYINNKWEWYYPGINGDFADWNDGKGYVWHWNWEQRPQNNNNNNNNNGNNGQDW